MKTKKPKFRFKKTNAWCSKRWQLTLLSIHRGALQKDSVIMQKSKIRGEPQKSATKKKNPKILVQCHAPKKPMPCATKKTVESHRPAKMMFSAPVSSGLLQKTNTLSAMARKKQQEENWKISRCSRKKTKFHNASRKNCGIWQKASRLKTAIISTGKLKTCGKTGKFSMMPCTLQTLDE